MREWTSASASSLRGDALRSEIPREVKNEHTTGTQLFRVLLVPHAGPFL